MTHRSVLLKEAIDGLNIQPGDIFVDGTLGGGGHLEEVVRRFGNTVVMIGIDLDPEALSRSASRLEAFHCPIRFVEGNFRNIDTILSDLGIEAVDKIILDIGLSSNQLEGEGRPARPDDPGHSGRGFSFQKDEPLVMSFKKNLTENDLTAGEILNNWDEENIRAILEGYGEEQFAYKIAKAIVERRREKPIETTFELVEIVKSATPSFYHHRKIHPATKTFQALRITVNDEIENLKEGVAKSFDKLKSGGRLAVISFHSLEDRIVKDFFRQKEDNTLGRRVTKRPTIPTEEEIVENSRSRSAKLRIIQKN